VRHREERSRFWSPPGYADIVGGHCADTPIAAMTASSPHADTAEAVEAEEGVKLATDEDCIEECISGVNKTEKCALPVAAEAMSDEIVSATTEEDMVICDDTEIHCSSGEPTAAQQPGSAGNGVVDTVAASAVVVYLPEQRLADTSTGADLSVDVAVAPFISSTTAVSATGILQH
jgi:hypothetical protein